MRRELVDEKWERAFARAEAVRQGFIRLIGDPGGGIALAPNTHELVVRLLSALPLRARPRLVTTDGEFHTIRRQLDRLAEEGLDVVRVPEAPLESRGRAAGGSGGRPNRRRAGLPGVLRQRPDRAWAGPGRRELPAPREPRCWWTPTMRSTWCRFRWPRWT